MKDKIDKKNAPNIGDPVRAATAARLLESIGYGGQEINAAIAGLCGIEHRPGLLTPEELCRCLRVSPTTLWRLELPFVRVGGRKRYDLAAVLEALE